MSTKRIIAAIIMGKEVSSELDTHADTCCVGSQCIITHDYGKSVTACGFDPKLQAKELRVVNAAVAYERPETGEIIIVMINQAIHMPTLDHNLLSTMQLRLSDMIVNDCPKFLEKNPGDNSHCIICPDPTGEPLRIPLRLKGVTSYFTTRKPTEQELLECHQVELTYGDPDWEPDTDVYANQEEALVDSNGLLLDQGHATGATPRFIQPVSSQVSINNARVIAETTSQDAAVLYEIDESLNEGSFARQLRDNVNISATSTSRKKSIDAATLARNWGIGIEAAAKTIAATEQRGGRSQLHPSLVRRTRTNDRHVRLKRLNQPLFGDLLESKVVSKRKNKYAHIFAADCGWCRAHPLRTKGEAPEALSTLFTRDGVPPALVVDGAKEFVSKGYKRKTREAGCDFRQLEPRSPWQNTAESSIRELKKDTGRTMIATNTPKKIWDDCLEFRSYIRSHTALGIYNLDGEVPETVMTGQTANIGPWCDFQWFQWVKYYDEVAGFPEDKQALARYLGPSVGIGSLLTGKLLKTNGNYYYTSSFRALTPEEIASPIEIQHRKDFVQKIEEVLGPKASAKDFDEDLNLHHYETPIYEPYDDDDGGGIDQMPDRDEHTFEHYDQYINAEVLLPRGDKMVTGKVAGRKRGQDGSLKGTGNDHPILDTRTYVVEFPDGAEAEYAANVLAENMYAQCDEDGNQYLLLDAVIDHRCNEDAIKLGDEVFQHHGRRQVKKTTKGWDICVRWKDGTTSWERLADLKEANPVELAEYAMSAKIEDQPAFKWWVPFTLKKRKRIIAAVNQRYHKRTHKFGIRLPKTVEEALRIDKQNGNRKWEDALDKEMTNVRIAFKMLNEDDATPVAHTRIRTHIIFDVKMSSLRHKCRLVAGGHVTEVPHPSQTYASVVTRESVRIALTLAALNDLQVKAADIQNAYLTAPLLNEKIWTTCGPEFGKDQGRRAIIVRALYGLRTAGHDYRAHIADCMHHLGYKSCLADPDVWMKPMVRPIDKFKYYAYALLYVDDILMIHHDGEAALRQIDKYFTMKPDSIGDPDLYLGAKFRKITLANGVKAYSLSPSKYVQESVRLVIEYLEGNYNGRKLVNRASAPFSIGYRPEMDISEELNQEEASYYHSQIGVLRWMVELGRVDIITEVSMLASHLALPRRGHLEAVFHIYAYLKIKHNSTMVFDPTYPEVNMGDFKQCDWEELYPDAKELIPLNAPDPRGNDVDLRMYVDSDHAGDRVNRRSRTGYFIYLNSAPVVYHSKKQNTVESSVFGAEFCAMTRGMERLRGLRYKLRMMGVEIAGPSYIYGDNMSVIHNTQRPESMLKKKSNSIAYHAMRESVAMGESLTGHIRSEDNPADICTKIISGGMKRDGLVSLVLHDLNS